MEATAQIDAPREGQVPLHLLWIRNKIRDSTRNAIAEIGSDYGIQPNRSDCEASCCVRPSAFHHHHFYFVGSNLTQADHLQRIAMLQWRSTRALHRQRALVPCAVRAERSDGSSGLWAVTRGPICALTTFGHLASMEGGQ